MTSTATIVLAVLCALFAIPHVYCFASFVWLYFLSRSSIKTYLHGTAPYALVTGATDGIGKATAAELLRAGFNLIIHGRNAEKMQKVVNDLRARVPERASADIRYFLADASASGLDFAQMIEPFKDLHITMVIHNVGGSDLLPEKLDGRTEDSIHAIINKNALFPLFLCRALLPHLRRAALSGPVLVQFVGSLVSEISPPRIPVYAATKGFLQSLVRGLDNDELYLGPPSGVRFTYLAVGSVHSDNHDAPVEVSLRTPTAEAFAKMIIDRVGCGRRRVAPYWLHGMMPWMLEYMSEGMMDRFSAQEMEGLIAQAQKGQS